MSRTCLIAIDPQADFFKDNQAIEPLYALRDLAEEADVVIVTQSAHPKDHPSFLRFGEHCIKGTKTAKLDPDLKEEADYIVTRMSEKVDLESFSAFEARTLRPLEYVEEILKNERIEDIWVGGFGHAWDVSQTARDANALGYTVRVFPDACYPKPDPELSSLGILL